MGRALRERITRKGREGRDSRDKTAAVCRKRGFRYAAAGNMQGVISSYIQLYTVIYRELYVFVAHAEGEGVAFQHYRHAEQQG